MFTPLRPLPLPGPIRASLTDKRFFERIRVQIGYPANFYAIMPIQNLGYSNLIGIVRGNRACD